MSRTVTYRPRLKVSADHVRWLELNRSGVEELLRYLAEGKTREACRWAKVLAELPPPTRE